MRQLSEAISAKEELEETC